MNKKEVRIENWYTTYYYDGKPVIHGSVYGHDRFEDGKNVRSSAIINVDLENNQIETLNTIYKLGVQSKDQIDGQVLLENIKEISNK